MTARSIAAPEVEDERSVLEILNVLLKRWRVVVGFPLVVAVVVVGISFLVPPTFTATTSFVPEMRSEGGLPGGLGALAGQWGISLGGEASQSPENLTAGLQNIRDYAGDLIQRRQESLQELRGAGGLPPPTTAGPSAPETIPGVRFHGVVGP